MFILSEPIICFDVDDTLVMFTVKGDVENHPDAIDFPCPRGGTLKLVPHKKHIEYLKKAKADGFKVVVWSWAGAEWAKNVIDTLQLNDHVDMIMAKPEGYVDDMDVSVWMPERTYIQNED